MSLHNGTAAETERKKILEHEGHIILNLGQNQYGDLEDVCHDIIIEVKTSKHSRRDLSKKEKDQMTNLLMLRPYRTIRLEEVDKRMGKSLEDYDFAPSEEECSGACMV